MFLHLHTIYFFHTFKVFSKFKPKAGKCNAEMSYVCVYYIKYLVCQYPKIYFYITKICTTRMRSPEWTTDLPQDIKQYLL